MALDPLLVDPVERPSLKANASQKWIRYIVAAVGAVSLFGLIVLILLLAIPITVLVIGVRYRDPHYCPIEPRISLFLIVNGSVSLTWIAVTILISIMTIFFASQRSFISVILAIILIVVIFISLIFSIIWTIIGSVWTFSVRSRVTHEYDTINHFYPFNYCHPVLYQFTFIYLILTYIFLVIQCCYRCFANMYSSRRKE